MTHSTLHWLYRFAERIEPYQIHLAGCAVALLGLWLLVRALRRSSSVEAQPQHPQHGAHYQPNPAESYAETKLYTGVSPLESMPTIQQDVGHSQPQQQWPQASQPVRTQSHQTMQGFVPPVIREITGELAPAPRASSLAELPDVMDIMLTSTWDREEIRELSDCDLEAWDAPTPQTINARPEALGLKRLASQCEFLAVSDYEELESSEYEVLEVDSNAATGEICPTGAFDVPTEVDPRAAARAAVFDVPTTVYPNEFGLVLLHERRRERTDPRAPRITTNTMIRRISVA